MTTTSNLRELVILSCESSYKTFRINENKRTLNITKSVENLPKTPITVLKKSPNEKVTVKTPQEPPRKLKVEESGFLVHVNIAKLYFLRKNNEKIKTLKIFFTKF